MTFQNPETFRPGRRVFNLPRVWWQGCDQLPDLPVNATGPK
jgi:hypothetical protein